MIVQYRPITYIKIRVPFHAIFKDSSQNTLPHILKLLTFRNVCEVSSRFAYSHIRIFAHSHIRIFAYSDIRTFAYSDIRIFRYSHIQNLCIS